MRVKEKRTKKETPRGSFWEKLAKPTAHLILEIYKQSYLQKSKTVKGALLQEPALSVYSDWKVNLTNTR